MAITTIRGQQVLDGSVQRADHDIATVGQATVTKLIQGSNITLSSTGADAGTGDVTVSAPAATSGSLGVVQPDGYTLAVGGLAVTPSALSAIKPIFNLVEIADEFTHAVPATTTSGANLGGENSWQTLLNGGTCGSAGAGSDAFNKCAGTFYMTTPAVAANSMMLTLPQAFCGLGYGVLDLFFRIAVTLLPTAATSATFAFGFTDSGGTFTNAVLLQLLWSSTAAMWQGKCSKAGVTSTTTATATPPPAAYSASALTFFKLQISINAAATSITFYVNGTSIGTITTNIPVVTTLYPILGHINGSAATAYTTYIDKFYYRYQIQY